MVNSTCIVDGDDDLFGEDDHMSHHYNTAVYFKDLPEHQRSKQAEFARTKASVFKKLSIVELSIYILLGLWDKAADYYVDYSGKLSREEIMEMLKVRAQRKEVSYSAYLGYLANPTAEARKDLAASAQDAAAAAFKADAAAGKIYVAPVAAKTTPEKASGNEEVRRTGSPKSVSPAQ
jgi:hypothetical protein